MATAVATTDNAAAPLRWSQRLRTRLLLAVGGLAAVAVITGGIALLAFDQVSERLAAIESAVPQSIAAVSLGEVVESLAAAAPKLLATSDESSRAVIRAEIATQTNRLASFLADVNPDNSRSHAVSEAIVELTAVLERLDASVGRRLAIATAISLAVEKVRDASDRVEGLLIPWRDILSAEIAALTSPRIQQTPADTALTTALDLYMATARVIDGWDLAASRLLAMPDARDAERVEVLSFQFEQAIANLMVFSETIDSRLAQFFLDEVAGLGRLESGRFGLAELRRAELAAQADGAALLATAARLSAQVSQIISAEGRAAIAAVDAAVADGLQIQRDSSRLILGLLMTGGIGSLLVLHMHLGRIAERLTRLGNRARAIAGGAFTTPVPISGADEIARMEGALEALRCNTAERDALLADRVAVADRLESEVQARTSELRIANTFQTQFLAAASHDLRQPLQALNLFMAQLKSAPTQAERCRLTDRVGAALDAMNDQLDTLLDMARLETGLIEVRLATFPVQQTLSRIAASYAPLAREKGLRLRVRRCDAYVRADPVLLERMLFNITANAIRYTSSGGILVGCRRRDTRLEIEVYDTGPGIASEAQEAIFEEYTRVRIEGSEGLGLGLSIVKRLSEVMQCDVTVWSEPGRGSCFAVSVPLAEGPIETLPAAMPSPLDLTGRKILVIEDDPLVAESLAGTLRDWGCIVESVPDVDAAVAGLTCGLPPDLVISDLRLGRDGTGHDAIDRLRALLGTDTPALLMTGDTGSFASNGLPVLRKPVAPLALRAAMSAVLQPLSRSDPKAGVGLVESLKA